MELAVEIILISFYRKVRLAQWQIPFGHYLCVLDDRIKIETENFYGSQP